jgi:hypothetical protein
MNVHPLFFTARLYVLLETYLTSAKSISFNSGFGGESFLVLQKVLIFCTERLIWDKSNNLKRGFHPKKALLMETK